MTPQKEISCQIFKMAIFSQFFVDLMSHIKREYAGKKIKWFLNVSPLTIVNILLWPFMVFSLYIHAFSKQQTKETTSWQTFAKRPASFVCLETFFLFQRRAFWRLNQDLRFPVDTQWKRKSSKNRLLSRRGLQINKRCLFLLEHIILSLELHMYSEFSI